MRLDIEKLTAMKGPLNAKGSYFVDADGDNARARTRDLERGLIPEPEKVAHLGIEREPTSMAIVCHDLQSARRRDRPRRWDKRAQ